jgi:hypothetical protein
MAAKSRKIRSITPARVPRAPIGACRASTAFINFLAPFCGQKLRIFASIFLSAIATFSLRAASQPTPEQIEFFETTIRPILAESCYKCHSEKENKSKGSLTLDTRDSLLKGGDTGPGLIAGNPDKSLIIQAVRYSDDDLQMPPEKSGGQLSAEKIAALEHWVKMGAPDPRTGPVVAATLDMPRARQHWAFQPVVKPPVPSIKNRKSPIENPLDAFVLAKLESQKLSPSPTADPRTLLRRVTYDLTGLPPTPAEVAAFLADRSPNAYTKVVDRLLASPRYGERWGRFWLDVARYADTQGYLVGNAERRFAYSHTYRDYVINAFNTDKPFDQFLVEQIAADQLPLGDDKAPLAAMGFLTLGRRFLGNQNDIIDDRIDVVSRGLMGLTVACARCHDHKFDPIPTRDYYALHGIFASSEEPAEKPLLGKLDETAPAYREYLRKKAAAEAKVTARADEEIERFLSEIRAKSGDYLLGAHDAANLTTTEKFELFAGPRKLNVDILKRWQPWLEARAKDTTPNPVLAPWFALAALPEKEFAEKAPAVLSPPTAASFNPIILAALIEKPPTSLREAADTYNRVFADIDTLSEAQKRPLTDDVSSPIENRNSKIEIPTPLPDPNREAIRQILYAADAPPHLTHDAAAVLIKRQINDKTSGLRREVEALNWTEPGAPLRAMSLVDIPKPHNSPIFLRGNPANKGPEAPRRFLEILAGANAPAATTTSGRLELARAIASPTNPLTARVFVNRVWGWHFGQPLVRTPSDFGLRTEIPVQRDLLDYLAATFVEGGWSVKKLQRAIVLSATYRQSSDETPAASAIDSDNQFLHRFNRHRLEFEALRDTLLAAAGQLDLTAGGLSDDLTKEPLTHRRTVYGFIDRQNLPSMFRTFDFPSPDTSSAQRFATTVPQQALFMMNSPFAQDQARHLIQRPEFKTARSDADKIRALYTAVFQRAPDSQELTLAKNFLTEATQLSTQRPAPVTAGWSYGSGAFDSATQRIRDFLPMTVRREGKDARISPTAIFPDPNFGSLFLTPNGGHPGKTDAHASIRRWTAPAAGVIHIEAILGHALEKGDGIEAHMVSSQIGSLGEWTVHNDKKVTNFADLKVIAGETVDFIVSSGANPNFDAYTWSPKITFTADADASVRTWDAKQDFNTVEKIPVPLTPLEALAQVLLLSNEFAIID